MAKKQDDGEMGAAVEHVVALQKTADNIAAKLSDAETIVKSLRREHEKALVAIQQAIRDISQPNLFHLGIKPSEEAMRAAEKKLSEPKAEPKAGVKTEADGDDVKWETITLASLGVSEKDLAAIQAEAEIVNLGDLMSWYGEGGVLANVDGLAKGKARKIEDLCFDKVRELGGQINKPAG